MTPQLQAIDLSCRRDERCLFEHLNLVIEPAQIYQIEGPNGSGKTTLLRVLCGLSTQYSGHLLWCGEPMVAVKAHYLSQLLYIGHSTGVKIALTPRENLQWYLGINGIKTACLNQTIEQALHRVGLYGYEDTPCYTLSAGQQRRVGLARLFLNEAKLWVLDEPFTAIDKHGVAELETWLADFADQGGSVVLTTHHTLSIERPIHRIVLGG